MARRGLLIILSSPSGAGKSTLAGRLRDWDTDIRFSVSATTRAARTGEQDGRELLLMQIMHKLHQWHASESSLRGAAPEDLVLRRPPYGLRPEIPLRFEGSFHLGMPQLGQEPEERLGRANGTSPFALLAAARGAKSMRSG